MRSKGFRFCFVFLSFFQPFLKYIHMHNEGLRNRCMLSYGKQHKKVKGIKSSRLYILPYVSKPSFHTRVIFSKESKEMRFFPRT